MGNRVTSPEDSAENAAYLPIAEEGSASVGLSHVITPITEENSDSSLSKSLPSTSADKHNLNSYVRMRSSSASHTEGTKRTVIEKRVESSTASLSNVSENAMTDSPSTSAGSESSFLTNFNLWKIVQTSRFKAHSVLNVGESSKRSPLRSAQSLETDRPTNSRSESSEESKRGWRWRPWGSSSSSSDPDAEDVDPISEMALQTIGLDRVRRTRAYSQGSWHYPGLKCPVCAKSVPPDDLECHLVMCLTKPRLSYNEDTLTEEKGECVICFEDLSEGETIARLPCLCIYHKTCIDNWFQVNRSCPEHPED